MSSPNTKRSSIMTAGTRASNGGQSPLRGVGNISLAPRLPSHASANPFNAHKSPTKGRPSFKGASQTILQAATVTRAAGSLVRAGQNNANGRAAGARGAPQAAGAAGAHPGPAGNPQARAPSSIGKLLTTAVERPALRIAVGVDGSALATKGLEVACGFGTPSRPLAVSLLHVILNPERRDHLGARYVRNKYEHACHAYGVATSTWVQKVAPGKSVAEKGRNITQFLVELGKEHSSQLDGGLDLLVLGSFGSSQEGTTHIIGSTLDKDLALLASPVNMCFVKPMAPQLSPGSPRTYVLATTINGPTFKDCFDQFIRQKLRPCDRLYVLYVRTGKVDPKCMDHYKEACLNYGINGHCEVKPCEGGENVHATILRFSDKVHADFLVFGIPPHMRIDRLRGTTPDECSRKARCHVIVLKIPQK